MPRNPNFRQKQCHITALCQKKKTDIINGVQSTDNPNFRKKTMPHSLLSKKKKKMSPDIINEVQSTD